ncbi:MAG: FMN-binding protein, partial [Oscillospiraceae bacterium]|nr:FMN-binding protein [Oscillospiraceae bacterium]
MKKIISGVVAAALAVSMLAGCSSEKLYTAGTYTGEAQGFGGKVSVTITTDAKKITAVESTGENETASIGGVALADLDAALLKAQSAEFDGVSGATLTSNGYKEAAAKAIAMAKGEEVPVGEIKFTPG